STKCPSSSGMGAGGTPALRRMAGNRGSEVPAMPSHPSDARNFWREVFALSGAATPLVLPTVLIFAAIATVIYLVQVLNPRDLDISIEVAPHEIVGALLGLLLVVRNNAGYDR